MARWQHAVAAVAAVAVGGGLACGVYLTITGALEATRSPSTSPSASSTPGPSASADPCDWGALPPDQRPALAADQAEGMPEAYALTSDVWACTGADWTVEVARVESDQGWPLGGTAQSIYLRSPAGDLVHLYDLRTDVRIEVVSFDVPAKVAWTARLTEADAVQVVQMDLADGYVAEDWGGDGIPDSQRHGGGVWNVSPVEAGAAGAAGAGGGELWLGFDDGLVTTAVFRRVEGRTFQKFSGQRAIDSLIANGSVAGMGEPGVTMWVADDRTYALALAQQPDVAAADPANPAATTGDGTWVVLDLARDLSRLTTSSIPPTVCAAEAEATLDGTYDASGTVLVTCPSGGDRYLLSPDADAVPAG